jgi:DNA-nicking Smr family endonuclease
MCRFLDFFRRRIKPDQDEPATSFPDGTGDPFDGFAIKIPIEDTIDLHTFDPSETREVLDSYLEEAAEHGFQRIRIIHGKGAGVQRNIVQSYLDRHPLVMRFQNAPEEFGGWGATIAYLDLD